MRITPEEQARRRAVVDVARHSTEMEGGRSSEQTRADQDASVRGELELDELIQRASGRDHEEQQ